MRKDWGLGVITADFVGSTNLSSDKRKRLPVMVSDAVSFWLGEKQDFQIFRGDSFQIRVANPRQSLKVGLGLRLYLKVNGALQGIPDLDARVSVGIGEESLHRAVVGKSDGQAYRLSGAGLDEMPVSQRLALFVGEENPVIWTTIALFLDDIVSNLTLAQAQAMLWALNDKNQEEIAVILSVSQAAVNQRLKSGRWMLVKQGLSCYETVF